MQATRLSLAATLALGSLGLFISSTGCQGIRNTTSTSAAKTLTSVSVAPTSANVQMGSTQQFTATAKYSDGSTANVSSTATWAVGNPSIASINSTGLVTGKGSGTTTVSASVSGMLASANLVVANVAAKLTSIAVTPGDPSIETGATQQFSATGTFSDGTTQPISNVTWTVSPTSVATISLTGLATGVAAGSATVTATNTGVSGSTQLKVDAKTVTAFAVTPPSVALAVGGTQQFTATATYNDGSQANVTTSASWSVGNAGVATVNSSGLAIALAQGQTTVDASYSGFNSSAQLTVNSTTESGANIPMYHVDQYRSGLNDKETLLTPANVTPSSFGKLFSYLVDGYVYGQPLLISNLTMSDGNKHNVLFAATENDSVYAFDADSNAGAKVGLLWKTALLQAGETPITDGPIQPLEGITSTPAIDTTTNTMYVVSAQTSVASGGTFRLYAIDITTGNQKPGSPMQITAEVNGGQGNDTILGTDCLQRAALLVTPGNPASLFIGFASCHSGWLLAYTYDGSTFTQSGVFNSSPVLTGEGPYASAGGVWMGGGGPVSDGNYVYITTGNGPWDGQTAFSDSVLKFTPALQLEDYFTPFVYPYMDCADADLASGGLLLIPGTTELLAGGKTGKLYLLDSGNMGKEQDNDTGATQTLWFEQDLIQPYQNTCTGTNESGSAYINSYEIFGTPAYFDGSAYLGITPTSSAAPAPMRQFVYTGALTPSSYTQKNYVQQGSYGTTPFISANGNTNGVLWMIDHGIPLQASGTTKATLRAYDPENLGGAELYDSNVNSGDVPGYGIKFSAPIAANGKVYLSTGHDLTTVQNPQGELDVYGIK